MSGTFMDALKNRRTIYTLGSGSPVPQQKIVQLVKEAAAHTPSAFNSQSARVALLFGEKHDRFWNIVLETLRGCVPADQFGRTERKIAGFSGGFGTALYFDDTAVTECFAAEFPLYANRFETWAEQANGMLQFAVWTLLEEAGLGVNLQHYDPLIDDAVRAEFKIPANWRLIAEMPFGAPLAPPNAKTFADIDKRVILP